MATLSAGKSYWQQEGGNADAVGVAEVPRKADVVIVGGGLAGLSTAIAVLQQKPGTSVVVLDAHFAGYGASGRNGGLMSPLPVPVWLLTADADADHAWALRTLNAKVHALGQRLAESMAESEVRSCTLDLQAMGRITTSALHRLAKILERAHIGYRLRTDPDRRGKPTLELPAYTVQPYRLVRALARHATSLGARICEHAAVAAVEDADAGAVVRLAGGGSVTAHRIVLCTNGYTGSLQLSSRPRAKVVRNYMIASEPLDARIVERLGHEAVFTVELNKSYIFFRVHRGRLVYGGVETFLRTPSDDFEVPASVRTALERHLRQSVPWCEDLAIATQWGGCFHSTATDLPIIGSMPGTKAIIFNVGYGGTGVALTQLFAPLAAAAALDVPPPDPEDARLGAIMQSTRLPLAGLLRFGGGIARDIVSGRAV